MVDRYLLVRKDGQPAQIPAGDSLKLRGAVNEAPIIQVSLLTDGNRLRPDRDAANTLQITTAGYGLSSIFTMPSGTKRRVILNDLTISNSANLQLIGGADIAAKLGDVADFISLGGGAWLMTAYTRKDGTALVVSGGGTGDKSFTYTQSTSSATWTIPHNLAKRPSVSVVDTSENEVFGNVTYVDDNIVQVSFSTPFAGKAYIN